MSASKNSVRPETGARRLGGLWVKFVQLLITGALLYWALHDEDLLALGTRFLSVTLWPVAIFIALQFVLNMLTAMRWRAILQYEGHDVSLARLDRILWISVFFNTFLISSVGQDLARGYYLKREKANMGQVVRSILLDRLMGLGTLALLAVPAMLLLWSAFPEFKYILWLGLGLLIVGVIVLAVFPSPAPDSEPTSPFFRLLHYAHRNFARFLTVVRHTGLFLRSFALSLAVHGITMVQFYLANLALGGKIESLVIILLTPAIQFLVGLPISISGLGVREFAFESLMEPLGTAGGDAIAVALLIFAIYLMIGLIGGVYFLFARSEHGHSRKAGG